ncbi:MAG: DeoR/GlpR family DNA-binding transcription regulator [Clostridia bacterium]|nr:DeoR/GlpR family DNA-binding transcription regulator [Clostridia bacterium]
MWDRRKRILAYIIEKGEASILELSSLFPTVSSMTIRRDLEYLEANGDVVRTKGGAKSIVGLSMRREEAYHQRASENAEQKKEIAEKTIPLLSETNSVYFDAGSTVMQIVKSLDNMPMLAITNDPNIAIELLNNPLCEVNIIGGRLNRQNISISGLGAADALHGIHIDTAVMAASGYTEAFGFTCGSYDEAVLKRTVIAAAKKIILVMDSTKIGRNHTFSFAEPSDVNFFVTDSQADPNVLTALKEAALVII